jgi:lipoprotein NlpD
MRFSLKAPKTVNFLISLLRILSILLLMSSCAANKAPVQDRMVSQAGKPGDHIVARGETLYSIAWRYGLDYNDLARRNGINSQFTIYPGQRLSINGTAAKASVTRTQPAATPAVKSPPQQPTPARSKTTTHSPSRPKPVNTPSGRLAWQWPAVGKVLAGYSSQKSLHMGVDIEARLGESVVAAADGVVVYAGSGIRGYGKLLIVKHNEVYLSAYAHNDQLLVQENTVVKAGQKIAEAGSTGTDRSKLHFEIRREGKPVDPLQYLPRR